MGQQLAARTRPAQLPAPELDPTPDEYTAEHIEFPPGGEAQQRRRMTVLAEARWAEQAVAMA